MTHMDPDHVKPFERINAKLSQGQETAELTIANNNVLNNKTQTLLQAFQTLQNHEHLDTEFQFLKPNFYSDVSYARDKSQK